tara:strand:+ start:232 stop:390 length:159 start_codon:yes stop_codon:yes gene_type:complete
MIFSEAEKELQFFFFFPNFALLYSTLIGKNKGEQGLSSPQQEKESESQSGSD